MPNSNAIETYADLLAALQQMTPEQLSQTVQVASYNIDPDKVFPGRPVFMFGTVDELEIDYFRSADDNRRHGEQFLLLCDSHPYSKSGVIAWEMDLENAKFDVPIYPTNHDDECDWTGPAQKIWAERRDVKRI